MVSRTLSGMFLVVAFDKPTKRKGTNREIPEGQIGTDESKSGNPRLNPPV